MQRKLMTPRQLLHFDRATELFLDFLLDMLTAKDRHGLATRDMHGVH